MLLSEKPVPRIFGGGAGVNRRDKRKTALLWRECRSIDLSLNRFKLNLFGPISEDEQRRLDAGSRSECQG